MKYVYEFIGTFFLILTIGMTVLSPNNAGPLAPLAIGSMLSAMVFAGGYLSGAHYNPAVSLAVYIRKKLELKNLFLYWAAQLSAALLGALVVLYFKGAPQETVLKLDIIKALLAEFLFTFALCYVVLNVATAKETQGNSFYGFAIGFTVLVGAYSVGSISGGAFNPAAAFGMSLMHIISWIDLWIFFVANLLGGACAAWVFNAAHAEHREPVGF